MKWPVPQIALDWLPLKPLRAILGQWPLIVSALIAAAIIHILVTLSAAQFSEAKAYRRLIRDLPVNQVTFAPPVRAKAQPLPFFSAGALYSYCPYDASSARIRLAVTLPEAGWSLSLHTPRGENFYYVAGSDNRSTDIKLMLAPPGNVFAHGSTEVGNNSLSVPTVKLPHVRGVIILRTPIRGIAFQRQADELRASFKCQAESSAT